VIARYLPRSLNLLTNESRADEREKLHDETGEQAGGSSSPFFLRGLPSFEKASAEKPDRSPNSSGFRQLSEGLEGIGPGKKPTPH
jgi:hypothetical protein